MFAESFRVILGPVIWVSVLQVYMESFLTGTAALPALTSREVPNGGRRL